MQKPRLLLHQRYSRASPNGPAGKEPACNAGNTALSPRSGRPLEEGMTTPSSILAGEIPWTEETAGSNGA